MNNIKLIISLIVAFLVSISLNMIAQPTNNFGQASGESNPQVNQDAATSYPQKIVGQTTIDLDSVFHSHQEQNTQLIESKIEDLKKQQEKNNLLLQIAISLASSILVVLFYNLLRKKSFNKRFGRISEFESGTEYRINQLETRLNNAINSFSRQSDSVNLTQQRTAQQSKGKNESKKVLIEQTEQKEQEQSQNIALPKQEIDRSSNVTFTYLTLSDKRLVEANVGQTSYYRCWHDKGKIYYEFFCDASKVKKAINNRDTLIAPCCMKDSSSVEPEYASDVKTVKVGELFSDFSIKEKTTIKYI